MSAADGSYGKSHARDNADASHRGSRGARATLDASGRGGSYRGGARGNDLAAITSLLAKSTLFNDESPYVHVIPSTANPAAFGFFGLGLTLVVMMAPHMNWTEKDANNLMSGFALFFAGIGQFLMGWLEFQRKNTFGCVVWLTYSGYWMATGFTGLLEGAGVLGFEGTTGGWQVANAVWGVVSLIFWLASFGLNLALNLLLLFLAILFWLEAAYPKHPSIEVGLGYFGFITAILSLYIGASIFFSDMYGRNLLPLGPFNWERVRRGRRFGPVGTRRDLGLPENDPDAPQNLKEEV